MFSDQHACRANTHRSNQALVEKAVRPKHNRVFDRMQY
jgi:hypothetical protein